MNIRRIHAYIATLMLLALCAGVAPVHAATATTNGGLEVTGWIPYWRASQGIRDAKKQLESLDTVHPFGYAVQNDGTLKDLFGLKKSAWKNFVRTAKKKDVAIVPTVMWSDGQNIHRILSDPQLRVKHVKGIASMVKRGTFDGIDIDYEGKLAETKEYFSLFLKELKAALGDKVLTCAIEARTPPESLYRIIPANIQYANDYAAIGTYCDRVQIMAYDQGRADIKLNDAKAGSPYIPVADADWVRKVMEFTALSIPKDKLMLGTPTYGREYEVTVSPNWYRDYRQLRSFNPEYAEDTAKKHKVKPSRNQAGELSASYFPAPSPAAAFSAPAGTPSGNIAAAQALAYANATGQSATFNLLWWSDAEAIEQKIQLADELGVRGVAIFKIDGEEDKEMWEAL